MRKIIICLLLMLLCINFNVFAHNANNENLIYINDELVECHYMDVNDTRMVPVREFSEKLGYNVFWNKYNASISISKSEKCLNKQGFYDIVYVAVGVPGITLCDIENNHFDSINTMDEVVEVIDGKSYISIFYLSKALDVKLKPFTDDKAIYINTRDYLQTLY